MAKKRTKKRDNTKHIRELSLLLPAFSYIWDRLEKVDEEHKKEDDVKLANSVATKMAHIFKRFDIKTQQKALELSNACMFKASEDYIANENVPPELIDEYGGLKVNVFSLGLGLLGIHHEHKNKVIHVGMINELVELQDYSEKNIDRDEINRAFKYSDYVYKYVMRLDIK